jgi:aldehyde:ferredoxin oxidoreductase
MALKGVAGKIGWVDLSSGETRVEEVSDEVYERYLGGFGLGAYYIYKNQKPGVDPLGPEAVFGLTTGLLTGTDAITGNRFVAVGKSPKTGGWGDANCGGDFGPALKQAGLDAVFFYGVSQKPVYALVEDGDITLRDAAEIWGRTCSETEARLKQAHGDKIRSAVIGPAGERISALACIINDEGRAAGRSGLGMVMGAKKLKAVAAAPGDRVEVADSDGLKSLKRQLIKEHFTTGNPPYDFFHGMGTPGGLEGNVKKGDCPVRNWAGAPEEFPTADRISGPELMKIKKKPYACWKCPVACGAIVEVESGPHKGVGHRPEYETLGSFGSMCLNDDLASICRLNNICNDYGLDTISTGCTVAFAMECFEKGLLTEERAGLDLTWGSAGAVVAMTEQLAKGEGRLYEIFKDGAAAAAEKLGAEAREYSMDAGGEELPMHDPRCFPGLGVTYGADATPGRHTMSGSWQLESGILADKFEGMSIEDKYDYSGKGEPHKKAYTFMQAVNAAGLCMFGSFIGPASMLPDSLTLASGRKFDLDETLTIGERVANLRMAFNAREGVRVTRDFKLPRRVLGDPPLASGPTADVTVDNETQIRDYFRAMGWDYETGRPKRETLERLGLDFAADRDE